MNGPANRFLPYVLSFFSSFCIMILELVASRLVARHVGASLSVWTSVIGIMLGGICLGNVLGGRLADRIPPGRAIGPLYALGSALTLACLWINSVVGLLPGLENESMPWELRTLVVVTLDFLIPATVLGMIGPIVAKMAVEQSRNAGSAIGLVYFLGAVGSIVGTFIAGFFLMSLAPTSKIVLIVGAAYALLAASMMGKRGAVAGLATAALLGVGTAMPLLHIPVPPGIRLGGIPINGIALAGNLTALWLAVEAIARLRSDRAVADTGADLASDEPAIEGPKVKLTDLAVLSFLASLAFMALEMVAGRLVTRHLGSSIYGWTSVIGVLLGGLSLGNFLGGKVADHISNEKQASWLFLIASVLVACVLLTEQPPTWVVSMVRRPIERLMLGKWPVVDNPDIDHDSFLSQAISMSGYSWWTRVLFWTSVVFLIPSIAMGTVSPVVAKLAVDRVRRTKRTGTAIGQVYAWGMVGSLLGTFLTGFFLIDWFGTKGVLLLLATMMALAATVLGSIWHAAWAGLPLGLCVIAFTPLSFLEKQGLQWGIREERGQPDRTDRGMAYGDESNYYYIKVSSEPDADGQKRVLVLDNLIHGYFILGHPERLDYDYEFIYSLVTRRIADAKAKAQGLKSPKDVPISSLFLGGGSYTFPRYLQSQYDKATNEVAEIDPAVTRANREVLGLALPGYPAWKPTTKEDKEEVRADDPRYPATFVFDKAKKHAEATVEGKDLPFAKPSDLDACLATYYKALDESYARKQEALKAKTTWGDARQYVVKNQGKKFDIVFGDAFNDFSVPWHLTTKEFNDKISNMLTPDGVFMINIIDVYESDETAAEKARAGKDKRTNDVEASKAIARGYGGFLGAWVETARLTFPHIYVFGTDEVPGEGLRETFVVVASKKPLDLAQLGGRDGDPEFFQHGELFQPKPFPKGDMDQVKVRSRGVILTDDYAPVENLLAPVAETRGD